MSLFATSAGILRGLAGCLDRAGPHRQVDRRAGPGLAGAWDARGAESAMARRPLAIGRRRAGAGGGPLGGSSDRDVSARARGSSFDPVDVAGSRRRPRGRTSCAEATAAVIAEREPTVAGSHPVPAGASPTATSPAATSRHPPAPAEARGFRWGARARLVVVVDLAGRRPGADGPADPGEPEPGAARPAVVGGS